MSKRRTPISCHLCGKEHDRTTLTCRGCEYRIEKYGSHLVNSPRTGTGVTRADRFWSKVDKSNLTGCWPWTRSGDDRGYGHTTYLGKYFLTHRLAWMFANGKEPAVLILHSCDNPPCCNPAHLREGTHKDNSADAMSRHRLPKGEHRALAKLDADRVAEIKRLMLTGMGCKKLSAQFGVSSTVIKQIKNGRSWSHVHI